MKIPLTNCSFKFEIDEEDFSKVSKFKWYALLTKGKVTGILSTSKIKGRALILTHYLISPPQGLEVDHKDRNYLNCKKENLRIATRLQNIVNTTRSRSAYTSKYKGVSRRNSALNPWRAVCQKGLIRFDKQFATEIEAARAYDDWARFLYGEFAVLNFPQEMKELKVT